MIILISYVCVIFNVYRQIKVGQLLDGLLKDQQGFADFEFLSYWQTQFNNIIAFTVFLAWIKVRKSSLSDRLGNPFRSSNMFHSTKQ